MRHAMTVVFAIHLLFASSVGAAITGTVMTPEGSPIAGAQVDIYKLESTADWYARMLSDTPDPKPLAKAATSQKGAFSIEGVKEPVVLLRVTADGRAPVITRIERDEEAGGIVLAPSELRKGRVTAGGKPVAGARVSWSGRGGQTFVTTDAEGRYAIGDPARFADRVIVIHPEYALFDEFRDRRALHKLDVNLDPGVTITGHVVLPDGTPAAGATLAVDGWPAGSTLDDGSFTIARAPSKWRRLEARSGNRIALQVPSADKKPVRLRLDVAPVVTGTVRDTRTNLPVTGAQISIRSSSSADLRDLSVLGDEKGNFAATLTQGRYELLVNRPGYRIDPLAVTLEAAAKIAKTIAAEPRARVSGVVVSEDGSPVAAARVVFDRSPGNVPQFRPGWPSGAISGLDGRFSLRDAAEGEQRLTAFKKGFPLGQSAGFKTSAGESKKGVTITIPTGFPVSGRVVDANGRPLADVAVASNQPPPNMPLMFARRQAFMNYSDRPELFVHTAADGTFTTRLKEGTYDFSFRRPGYAPATNRGIQVTAGTKPIEVTLEPSASISGRVVRGGAGVEGLWITTFVDPDATTRTAADGSFQIVDLPAGPVDLSIGSDSEFVQERRAVNAPATGVVIELAPGVRVTGRVVDKLSKRPLTSFEAGIDPSRANAFIGPPRMRTFTSENGSFVLENVPAGRQEIVADAPGYSLSRVGATLEAGRAPDPLEIELERGTRVHGRVTAPDGRPLAGVAVRTEFDPMERQRLTEIRTSTDSNGEYSIDGIESGEHTLIFALSGFISERKEIEAAGRDLRTDVQLTRGMRISGTVVNEAGAAVPDATVSASSSASRGGGRATTDAAGAFTIEGVTPGRFTFRAVKQGVGSGTATDVDISSGAPVRITLQMGGTIYGRVSGLSPEELKQSSVTAFGPYGAESGPVDGNGVYRIENVSAGNVRVMARTEGSPTSARTTGWKNVQVEPGGSVEADLEFVTGSSVAGRVTLDGQPVPSAYVFFSPRDRTVPTSGRVMTDPRGEYEAKGLLDGEYNVQIADSNSGASFGTTYTVRGGGRFDIEIKGTTVRGRAVDASTGQPLADVFVQLQRPEGADMFIGRRQGRSDSAGEFVFDNVSAGQYQLTAEKKGYGARAIDVAVAASGVQLDVKLAKADVTTVEAVDARDGRALRALIDVRDATGRRVTQIGWNGGGDRVSELNLAPGPYAMSVGAPGYASEMVTLTAPGKITVRLTPGGTIEFRSGASQPRGVRLVPQFMALPPGFRPQQYTVLPGVSTFQHLRPGAYTMQILGAADAVSQTKQVTIVEGQTTKVDV